MTVDIVVNKHEYRRWDNVHMPRNKHLPAPVNAAFHSRLHTALQVNGVDTQAKFMRLLKINRQTAHKWWHGLTSPDTIRASDAFKIADALNISMRWLIQGPPEGMMKRPSITHDQARILEIFNSFKAEHEQWRDDWITDGVRRLEMLGISAPFKAGNAATTALHQKTPGYKKA